MQGPQVAVWRELPPRMGLGACSATSTEAPRRAAVMAAESAALPPPTTSTSQTREKSTMGLCIRLYPELSRWRIGSGPG
jgi:hypothetical protein